ncbi:MAG: MotA/TolQ/ExbB proton channel family protein [Spirochaetes bacterium]|nr:MotA/TolQ/ExbB proton channel family protein [Spirochaetota bacterium]
MEIGMIIGIVGGFSLLVFSIVVAKSSVLLFVDIPSVMITVGGSIGAMLVGYSIKQVMLIPTLFKVGLFPPRYNYSELIVTIVSFSEKARREGLLALEDDLDELDDAYMKKGLQLVVDGTDPELVRNILETEIEQMAARHDDNKRMFDDWASFAPAFGMIGTLMGLIMMLVNLSDRAAIGPYLAVALITTLYGAIICYLFCSPLASRLDVMTNNEVLMRSIVLMGVLSIQSGDNPRIVKDKLVSFLPPKMREEIAEEVAD